MNDQIKDFADYFWSFYGPKGIYKGLFIPALGRKEMNEAIKIWSTSKSFDGDSVDREMVRLIISNLRFKQFITSKTTTAA